MNLSPAIRIIDANLNRLAEGLRVLEEVARMILDDTAMTQQLKTLRHALIRRDLPFNLELLQSRNSATDVGATLEVSGEDEEKGLPLIVVANSRRAQESLRVLEEMAKLTEIAPRLDTNKFKSARFELYALEQKLISRLTRQDKVKKISGLYVIIDIQDLHGRNPIEVARQVIEAGVKVIQLRDKNLSKKQLMSTAREMQLLCKQNDVLFVLNDYLDVALAIEADGLHLGQGDLPVEVARKLLPLDKILGCSVSTAEEAMAGEAAGADYVAVDNIDASGIETLRQIKRAAKTPVVAVGGISKDNIHEVMKAGADSIGVTSAVLDAPEITPAAREIINIIEAENGKTDGKSR